MSLKESLTQLTLDPTDVMVETLGDETLWVVKNCTMGDLVDLFEDPVDWVKTLPGSGFTLINPFVIQFQLLQGAQNANPTYLISGIDGTAVVSVRVSGSITNIPADPAARKADFARSFRQEIRGPSRHSFECSRAALCPLARPFTEANNAPSSRKSVYRSCGVDRETVLGSDICTIIAADDPSRQALTARLRHQRMCY